MTFHEDLQLIQLAGYNAGKLYQAGKQPIQNTVQNRIKLPICKIHNMDPLTAFCKTCGISAEELVLN